MLGCFKAASWSFLEWLHRRIAEGSLCLLFVNPLVFVREVEPPENHLKDMLQQLTSVMAAKPSEKTTVCQG